MRGHRSSATAGATWRRVLSVPAAVGAVTALTAGAGAQAASRPDAAAPAAAAVTSASGAVPGTASSLGGTWRLLPGAPVTRSPGDLTAVWTGHEMIIHGNYSGPQGGIRGVTFAWRPGARSWARLAGGPARSSAFETTDVAVWTGSRVLVAGQTSAVYNPAANTWRSMPFAPMSMLGAVTGWTGHRFLAWGGTCCEDNSRDGFAYIPASNTWRKLPAAPLSVRRDASGAWTGRELVVAGGFTTAAGPARALRDGAAYNPVTGRWRTIAPMPLGHWGARAVWDGKEVLFIGGSIGAPGTGTRLAVRGLAYNPAANRWRWLPKMAFPRSGFAALWTGRRVLVWGGLTAAGIPPPHGEAYTPATGRWAALPASPLRGRADPVAVWTGRRMIVWGGSGRTDGAVYTPAPAGSWGRAIEVPGLAALNKGGNAYVNSVSCTSAGSCAAGGNYQDQHGHYQGFVAGERNGRWGTAIEVPGLAALNTGGDAGVRSVSCASAGNCAADGGYTDRHRHELVFVVSEKNGRWGTAIEVPGLAALNKGPAELFSVSCGSAGNCAAGGGYTDSSGHGQGFVVSEKNGRWRTAMEVPGLAALNTGGSALVWSVSCGSAGNCAAGGFYGGQGFVAVERNGVWGKAIEVPGLGALNAGGDAYVESVSCASAGSCAAIGTYALDNNPYYAHTQGFVAVEKNGRWGRAIAVPGLKALNAGRNAYVNSVSCGSAGNCAAGGQYSDRNETYQAFVAVERNGVWGKAIEVPGLGTLETSGNGDVLSVSCGLEGDCTAGGTYGGSRGYQHGFVT